MSKEDSFKKLHQLSQSYLEKAQKEFNERWDSWEIDFSQIEYHEVIGALVARQMSLTRNLVESPNIWNGHVAPIILRAMADVYISIAWIFKDPIDRSQKYIQYGLGQAKLELEHRKAQIEDRKPSEQEKSMIEHKEHWINSQKYDFLTKVNLGSWSGKSTRAMADEAGCLDFYNYVYSPFSACSHSTWQHVGRINIRYCENPLHKYHRIPADPESPIDTHYFYLAAKYLEKTFNEFDRNVDLEISADSAFDFFNSEMQNL